MILTHFPVSRIGSPWVEDVSLYGRMIVNLSLNYLISLAIVAILLLTQGFLLINDIQSHGSLRTFQSTEE
jgi:hypothetical protein